MQDNIFDLIYLFSNAIYLKINKIFIITDIKLLHVQEGVQNTHLTNSM
jgi:hypothetical protein